MTADPSTSYRSSRDGLTVEHVGDEVLIYDTATDQVHRLSGDAAAVWTACADGATETTLAASTGRPPEVVGQALTELEAAGLVEASGPAGMTRRAFAIRAGMVGAGIAAAALVTSVAAPLPAAAASGGHGGGGGGTTGGNN
jgi:hypothetical protein